MTIRENPRLLRRNLALRSRLLAAVRAFFLDRGYVEVETPVRIPAPIPEAHIEPVPADGWVLQTSPEVCMKRLLALGLPRIFQIARCFRKNERGKRHLPEMSLLEWYSAGMDYRDLMEETEALVRHAATALEIGNPLVYGEKKSAAGRILRPRHRFRSLPAPRVHVHGGGGVLGPVRRGHGP